MWRATRYLLAFASGQALEAWLSQRLERPSYAAIGERVGARLDRIADQLAAALGDDPGERE